jgi:phage tail-like protein
MADYPLPVFHFKVSWGQEEIAFSEVSGLNIENQAIEYRHGNSKSYSPLKMPGIPKYANITLKRGILAKDNKFYQWINEIALNKVGADNEKRCDLIISLLNESHEEVMTWKAVNTFPVKVEGPSLKSTGNEVAIESIELAHEGLSIENG